MRKMAIAFGALILLALATTSAFASGWGTTGVQISQVEVDSTSGTPTTYVRLAQNPNAGTDCGAWSSTKDYLLIGGSPSAESARALTALATAALLSGKYVKVYLSATCYNGYAVLSHLQLTQ